MVFWQPMSFPNSAPKTQSKLKILTASLFPFLKKRGGGQAQALICHGGNKKVSFLNFIEQSKILKSKEFPPFEKGGPGGI
jgi:hypothetical protein